MKKTLLILSLLIFWGCSGHKKKQENLNDQYTSKTIFFTSDSTLFLTIQSTNTIPKKDSILKANDFVKQPDETWVKGAFVYKNLTKNAFSVKVKGQEQIVRIQQKMKSLHGFNSSDGFTFGVQLLNGKPLNDLYLLTNDSVGILKIFPRSRF